MKISDMALLQFFCPNCGRKIAEMSNEKGAVRTVCQRCKVVLVSRKTGKREISIRVTDTSQDN